MATESVTEKMTDDELRALAHFAPAIDDETMQRMEEGAAGAGFKRRLTLLALARSADVLSGMSVSDPDTYGHMLADVESFRDHAKALLEGAEIAVTRMKIADRRSQRTN